MPRYLDIAAALQKDIAAGRVKIGAQLPTEHDLCAAHDVSRHTARAALKVLEDQGLIERRPGLGTRVVANAGASHFVQPLGGLEALLQYAHEARLKIVAAAPETLSATLARRLGAARGETVLRIDGVRRAGRTAVAATTIRVAGWIGARLDDVSNPRLAVTEQIERRFGVAVARIAQRIAAGALSAADAEALDAAAGAPALVTLRRYYDAADRLFVVSESRHPADRFAYEMSFRRGGVERAPGSPPLR